MFTDRGEHSSVDQGAHDHLREEDIILGIGGSGLVRFGLDDSRVQLFELEHVGVFVRWPDDLLGEVARG